MVLTQAILVGEDLEASKATLERDMIIMPTVTVFPPSRQFYNSDYQ